MFGYAFGQILAGPLSDRFGRRPMLLIGLSVYTLSGLGCMLARGIDALIVLRFVQALSAAVGPSMSRAIIRDYHGGPRASHMLSSVQLAMGFALVAAPIIGSLVLILLQLARHLLLPRFVRRHFERGGLAGLCRIADAPRSASGASGAPYQQFLGVLW